MQSVHEKKKQNFSVDTRHTIIRTFMNYNYHEQFHHLQHFRTCVSSGSGSIPMIKPFKSWEIGYDSFISSIVEKKKNPVEFLTV